MHIIYHQFFFSAEKFFCYPLQRDLQGHLGDVYTCKFFPSGIVVLSGGADMQLKVWSAETGQCAANIIGHKAGTWYYY